MPFFLLFVIIPFVEIIVFMSVSDVIGLGTALLMALITAVLGGVIVRYQGLQTLMAAQKNLRQGILPSKEFFDGLCLVAAGATLITPGFITDAIGFALLVPALRELLRGRLLRSGRFEAGGFHSNSSESSNSGIIEAEYEQVDDDDTKKE